MSLNLGSILQASAQDRPDHVAIRLDQRALTLRGARPRRARRRDEPARARHRARPARRDHDPERARVHASPTSGSSTRAARSCRSTCCSRRPRCSTTSRTREARAADRAPAVRGAGEQAARSGAGVPVVWADGAGADDLAGAARRRRRSTRSTPTLARRHRGDPLHLGHHGQAEGRRAHALEPVRQLRGGGAEAARRSAPTTSRSRRCRCSTRSGRPASRTRRIAAGGTFTLLPRFTPDEALRDHGARPRHAVRGRADDVLRAAPPRGRPRATSRALRWCMSGGARDAGRGDEGVRGEVRRRDPRGLRPLRDLAGRELQHARPPAHAGLDRLPGVGRRDGDPRREGPARCPTASAARSASAATTS